MSKPIIFVGTSLTHQKARKIFDAEYRPPAKKGDLLMLSSSAFSDRDGEDSVINFVGLIDGLFLQDYPPTPIEVYQLLSNKNIRVVGGASIGALRAVELEKFGMVGVGKIFELYKNGTTDSDDEVAVTFQLGDEGGIQSEAMIDIRYNLFLVYKRNIISESTKRILSRIAKSTYFPYRSYSNIIQQTIINFPDLTYELDSLSSYIEHRRASLKEHDAIKVVEYIKAAYEEEQRNLMQ